MLVVLFLLWIAIGVVIAVAAKGRGREPLLWFIYGFLIWPIALIHLFILPKTDERIAHEAGVAAQGVGQARLAAIESQGAGRQPCPYCAELILPAAKLCPHCKTRLEDLSTKELA